MCLIVLKNILMVFNFQNLEEDLQNRSAQMESVQTTGKELIEKASKSDAQTIRNQLGELNSLWTRTNKLAERKTQRLEEALKVVSAN